MILSKLSIWLLLLLQTFSVYAKNLKGKSREEVSFDIWPQEKEAGAVQQGPTPTELARCALWYAPLNHSLSTSRPFSLRFFVLAHFSFAA